MTDDGIQAGMRRATTADAAGIADILVDTWRATYAGILPDDYLVNMRCDRQAAGWRRHIGGDDGGRLTLVMEEGGSGIVGFANAGPVRKSGLPRGSDIRGEVYTLYVGGDWQGRGYGRALLHGAMAALFENGLGGVVVWVLAANPSRFFYEAMGGVRLATRRESFAGVDLDEVGYVWRDMPVHG